MSNYDDWKCNPPERKELYEDEDGRYYYLPYGVEPEDVDEHIDLSRQLYHVQECMNELTRLGVSVVESGLRDYVQEFWSEIVDFNQTPAVTVEYFLKDKEN